MTLKLEGLLQTKILKTIIPYEFNNIMKLAAPMIQQVKRAQDKA